MKRLFWLLPLLLLLCGCGKDLGAPSAEPLQPPETAALPVIQTAEPRDAPDAAEPPTEPEALPPTEPLTETPTEPPKTQYPGYQYGDTTPTWDPARAEGWPADADCSPELLLEKWLAVEGLTTADLAQRDCGQLILAAAQATDGVETLAVCYERDADGRYVPVEGLDRLRGHMGKKGLMHDRRIDSFTSPAGLWALGPAFGNETPPEGLKLPWRQVTPNSDWVCDVDSPYFNTWQERDDPTLTGTWNDEEHLEDYPEAYAWACVIGFNLPPDTVPERGCAIFLHCGERGTAGCVSLPQAELRSVLLWLDPEKRPYILITGVQLGAETEP